MAAAKKASVRKSAPAKKTAAAKKPMVSIKPSKKGSFTAAAKKAGRSVQAEASAVLANKNSSPAMRKKANFARNAAKWKH